MKTHWILLLTSLVVSGCSLILVVIAFLTPNWIEAEASYSPAINNSQINFGLFKGSLVRHLLATATRFDLSLACSFDHDACMYSCQLSEALRDDELARIIRGDTLLDCLPSSRKWNTPRASQTFETTSLRQVTTETNALDSTIPASLWLTTVLFLSLAAAFGVFSMAMAAINIFTNPVQPIWGVFGLYIWNASTSVCALITVVIWGILYGSKLSLNVAVTDTLQQQGTYDSNGLAQLGFSYWVLIGAVLAPMANCGLLHWRSRLLEAEPKMPTFIVEAKNNMTGKANNAMEF